MITYPTIFFGAAGGPIKEDFEEYPLGALPVYDQIWQYRYHQWLSPKKPTKYVGFTWKDYGISGAFDAFEDWTLGSVDISSNFNAFKGDGNFEIHPWEGFSAGFYRDARGQFTSADQLTGYSYINFDWGNNAPLDAYKSDNWSAKFIGKLTLPFDGTYQLYVERDDSAQVFIGREDGPNTQIFNGWSTPPVVTIEPCTPFTYTAGEVDILINFYDTTGPSKLKLYWAKPVVDGGGPVGPPVIINPGDFGNSGFVQQYCAEGPYFTHAMGNVKFDGSYRPARVYGDAIRGDIGKVSLSPSGNYIRGVVYDDIKTNSSKNNIGTAGFYIFNRVQTYASDLGKTTFDPRGFYVYKTAFARIAEPATNTLAFHDGYYANKNVVTRNLSFAQTIYGMDGIYVDGLIGADTYREPTMNALDQAGFYASTSFFNYQSDAGMNQANLVGTYFPIYVYTSQREFSYNNLLPSGYYITGHVITDKSADIGKNTIIDAGFYAYGLVTGDKMVDYGKNTVGFDYGLYLYKYVGFKTTEAVSHLMSYAGNYSPRFSNVRTTENANNSLRYDGIYYPRFLNQNYKEPAKNILDPRGYYVLGHVNTFNIDNALNRINPAGHYVSGYVPVKYSDFSETLLNTQGNYFIGIESLRALDLAKTTLSFKDSFYQGIYVYTRNANNAVNRINPQGLYYWGHALNYENDLAKDVIDMQGFYLTRFTTEKEVEPAYNKMNSAGQYLTGYIKTYDRDFSNVNINPAGNFFYRYISGNYAEYISNKVDMLGVYFYRFLSSYSQDQSSGRYNLNGYYAPRYVYDRATENASGLIDMQGVYFGRYGLVKLPDFGFNTIGFGAASYYTAHAAFKYQEPSYDIIGMAGEIFSRFVTNRTQEPSYNNLGISEGTYFTRYTTARGQDTSANLLVIAGDYSRESWVSTDSTVLELDFASEFLTFNSAKEYSSLSANFSGTFVRGLASTTMDYWLEIYQRPTYNMGKTQQYFSI